jgi:response regulator NasT
LEFYKYIVTGEDKNTLAAIKNMLLAYGHIFLGYDHEPQNILRHVRRTGPDLVILEAYRNFSDLRPILEVMDDELLTVCVLVLREITNEVYEFISKSRNVAYITLPVKEESIIQIIDLAVLNYRRILDYEDKVKKLNEALESRKVVERAKWVLVEENGITESEAFELIRKKSRDSRMQMREIAQAILMVKGINN